MLSQAASRRIGGSTRQQAVLAASASGGASAQTHFCWEGNNCRFPQKGFGPPVAEDKWKQIIKKHFGDDVLHRTTAAYTPPSSAAANPAPYCAISLANLRKVRDALKELAEASTETAANIKNTNSNANFGGGKVLHWTEVTMHLVNGYIVMPMLASAPELSFVELVGGGQPTHFVSHSWGGRFASFVHAVEGHFEQLPGSPSAASTYYWVCTFANRQMKLAAANDPIPVAEGPFAKAIELVKASGGDVVAVQDDGVKGEMSVNRIWCAFEMYKALMEEVPIKVACANKGLLKLNSGKYDYDPPVSDTHRCTCKWKEQLQGFSVEKAETSNDKDKTDIRTFMNTAAHKTKVCKGLAASLKGEECLDKKILAMVPDKCYGSSTLVDIAAQGDWRTFRVQFSRSSSSSSLSSGTSL